MSLWGSDLFLALGLKNRMQPLRRLRLAELLERPRLQLPHPLTRQAKTLADLLERMVFLAAQAVAEGSIQDPPRKVLPGRFPSIGSPASQLGSAPRSSTSQSIIVRTLGES